MTEPETLVLREIVALVSEVAVLAPDSHGVRRLPVIDGDGWPSLTQLCEAVDCPGAAPVGPPQRFFDRHGVTGPTTLHVLSDPAAGQATLATEDWLPLDRLVELADDAEIADAVARTTAEAAGRLPLPEHRPDWLLFGWFDEACAWIDEQLVRLDLRRTGPTTALQVWSLAALLTTPVTDAEGRSTAVVLKASCGWFATEPGITRAVGMFAAGCTPAVLAVDEGRAWMLMGELLSTGQEHEPAARRALALVVAPVVARLQLAALEHLDDLREAGLPDRTLAPTLEGWTRLLAGSIELDQLTEPERVAARDREAWVRTELTRLDACGIPSTLVHGDLHLDNVATEESGPVLYDWSDACIGHPFIDAAHLVLRVSEEDRPAVLDAYAAPWRQAFPDADADEAIRLSVLADRVFQAISYEDIQRHQEAASRWEMTGAVANILREVGRTDDAG